MSIIVSVLVISYCIIGFITHIGIQKEWRKDTSKELDEFNPVFIQMSLVTVAMLWPILVGTALYQKWKEKV